MRPSLGVMGLGKLSELDAWTEQRDQLWCPVALMTKAWRRTLLTSSREDQANRAKQQDGRAGLSGSGLERGLVVEEAGSEEAHAWQTGQHCF